MREGKDAECVSSVWSVHDVGRGVRGVLAPEPITDDGKEARPCLGTVIAQNRLSRR
jgi:hypothetical protein